MVWPAIIMGAGMLIGGIGQYQAGQATKEQSRYNAAVARLQAKQVLEMAENDVNLMREQEQQIYSEQTAAFSGQGVDLGSEIVERTTEHTEMVIAQDIATLQNNARLKAWGLRSGAQADITAGNIAARAGISQAAGTILSGAGNIMYMNARAGA